MTVTGVLTGVLVLVGAFMTFLIMLQEGKGGGLTALGGTKAAGIEGVTNPIRRATAYMAGLFFLLAIALAMINRPSKSNDFFAAEPAALPAETNASTPVLGAGPGGSTTPTENIRPPVPAAPAPVPVPVPAATPAVSTTPATSTAPTPSTVPATPTVPAAKTEATAKPTEPAAK